MSTQEPAASKHCPSLAQLRAFDMGLAADDQIALIAAHLDSGCNECTQQLDEFSHETDDFRCLVGMAVNSAERPRTIRHYQIEAEIGRGGMGVVYRATDPAKRTVALKQLLALGASDKTSRERFRIETEAWAKIKHPHVVRLLDSGIDERGIPYLVLEFIGGPSLDQLCPGRPMEPRRAADLVRKVAIGIQCCHESGVVHRDIKPSNILMTASGEPLVTDFGLARLIESNKSALTRTGVTMGTPQYMSPEQAFGNSSSVGERSDVYSIGATLYELLSGHPPFLGSTSLQILQQVKNSEPISLRRKVSAIPRDLETICLKCLEKDATKRYSTAAALAEDLQRFLEGRPISARRIGPLARALKWSRRNRAATILIATLAISTISVSWFAVAERVASRNATLASNRATAVEYLYNCRMANVAWRDNSISAAQTYLNQCPTNERNIEWYLLNNLCHQEKCTIYDAAHSRFVQWSPDGQRLLSFSNDNSAQIWDATTGECLQRFPAISSEGAYSWSLHRMAFTPNKATSFVVRDLANHVDLWRGTQMPVSVDGNPIMRLSPNDRWLASSYANTVYVWDFATGSFVRQWDIDVDRIVDFVFHPHQPWLLTIAAPPESSVGGESQPSNQLVLWELPSGRRIRDFEGHKRWPNSADFSNDGLRLVSGTYMDPRSAEREELILWDVETGQSLDRMLTHKSGISSVDFHPDGQSVLTAGKDGLLKSWAFDEDGRFQRDAFRILRGHEIVRWAGFDPSGKRFATNEDDNAIRIWDYEQAQGPAVFRGHPNSGVFSTAISPDSSRIATGGSRGVVKLSELATGKEIREFKGLESTVGYVVNSLAFSPDGKRLVAGGRGDNHQGCLWDVESGELIAKLFTRGRQPDSNDAESIGTPPTPASTPYSDIKSVAFDPNGNWFVTAGTGPFVRVWSAQTGELINEWSLECKNIDRLDLSPDGRLALACEKSLQQPNSPLEIREPFGGTLILRFDQFPAHHCFAFSPDPNGRLLAVAVNRFQIHIVDSRTGREVSVLWRHNRGVSGLAFTPDCQRLISVSDDHSVRIWDVASGRELLNRDDHPGAVRAVAYAADQKHFVTAGWGNTTLIWDIERKFYPDAGSPQLSDNR